MATGKAVLDRTQYVRINAGYDPIKLQAHGDEVRVVLSESQPALSNSSFHLLDGSHPPFDLPIVNTNVWAWTRDPARTSLIVTEIVGGNLDLAEGLGKGIKLSVCGQQKISQDMSLQHAIFTHTIPDVQWREVYNDSEQAFTNATSTNGMLKLVAGGTETDETVLESLFMHIYRPRRGLFYSASVMLPSPTAAGVRDFGLFLYGESGVFFRLKSDGNLYACRTTTYNSVSTTDEELITVPFDIDLEKVNQYEIQTQVHASGRARFCIHDPAGCVTVVHTMSLVGSIDRPFVVSPSLPMAYRCENLGDNVELYSVSADLSVEGDYKTHKTYRSLTVGGDTGEISITGYNIPILVMRSNMEFNGLRNTRMTQSVFDNAFGSKNSVYRVWTTRDETAINLGTQSWESVYDGNIDILEYDPGAVTPITFDTSKASLLFSIRAPNESAGTFITSSIFDEHLKIFSPPGEITIFTMHASNGGPVSVGLTYEYAEEI